MDKFFKLGILILGTAVLVLYWLDVRPSLRQEARNVKDGRYQFVVRNDGMYVLDTQHGMIYVVTSVDGKAKFLTINPLTGKASTSAREPRDAVAELLGK